MKKISRSFLFLALVMVLLTAACGAETGATPTTIVGTLLPGDTGPTGTPFATEALGTAEITTAIGTGTGVAWKPRPWWLAHRPSELYLRSQPLRLSGPWFRAPPELRWYR